MKKIGVGLLGLGTVGGGVASLLHRHSTLLAARAEAVPVLRRIADKNPQASPEIELDRTMLTTDPYAVIADPSVQVVVELIGGTDVARELALAALRAGKPVVTANKALLARHGAELFAESRRHNAPVYFEASVAGGIPVLRAIREGLVANRFRAVKGIVNGTCNYILTLMEQRNCSYETALEAARTAGYAEKDPSLDVDGWDSAHKAAVLAALAWGEWLPPESLPCRGIRGLEARDIELAAAIGFRIKLLALLREGETGAHEVCVEPCLVPADSLLGLVNGVFNAVLVRAEPVGDTFYYGRGAGREATASAVVSDLVEAAAHLAFGGGWPIGLPASSSRAVPPSADMEAERYLRISFNDTRAEDRAASMRTSLMQAGFRVLEAGAHVHVRGGGSSWVARVEKAAMHAVESAAAEIARAQGADPNFRVLRIEDA